MKPVYRQVEMDYFLNTKSHIVKPVQHLVSIPCLPAGRWTH